MTNEDARALYGRAVAAGFRIEPGCRVTRTRYMHAATPLLTVVRAWVDGPTMIVSEDDSVCVVPTGGVWCDFREAPSLGCLLGQVRAAWGDPYMVMRVRDVQTSATYREPVIVWCVDAGPGRARMEPMGALHRMTMAQWRTEAEALVAALEAAPKAAP